MHELSIVTHVAKTLDEIAFKNNLKKIGSVTLEVGEVSGIMTDYFKDCWNYFKVKNPLLEESELILEEIPAITFCEDCKKEYKTIQYGKICPYCKSEHTYLLQGNECTIKQIEAQD